MLLGVFHCAGKDCACFEGRRIRADCEWSCSLSNSPVFMVPSPFFLFYRRLSMSEGPFLMDDLFTEVLEYWDFILTRDKSIFTSPTVDSHYDLVLS